MTAHNLYDVLFFKPEIEQGKVNKELENLAQQLVVSGKIRISTDDARNFVPFSLIYDDYHAMFSRRELTDKNLLPETRRKMAFMLSKSKAVKGASKDGVKHQVEEKINYLLGELKKSGYIPPEKEIKLARIMVQCAHPAVIKLLLKERVEVFISYSHNIQDTVVIRDWNMAKGASGLQRTDYLNQAVYVAAMGDPVPTGDHKTYTTDGFPALARMAVIAGQELGHFADQIRDNKGNIVGRYSTDLYGRQASEEAKAARKKDMAEMRKHFNILKATNLAKIKKLESDLEFYRQHRKGSFKLLWMVLKATFMKNQLLAKARTKKIQFINKCPAYVYTDKGRKRITATHIFNAANDMMFNLSPEGYETGDSESHQAVLCAEALARVPQQALKWGHDLAKTCMPNLYRIYYAEVIPACKKIVE